MNNHGQKSWDTFAFLGCFPIHTGPSSALARPTNIVGRVYPEFDPNFSFAFGGGEGELQKNFEKVPLF